MAYAPFHRKRKFLKTQGREAELYLTHDFSFYLGKTWNEV